MPSLGLMYVLREQPLEDLGELKQHQPFDKIHGAIFLLRFCISLPRLYVDLYKYGYVNLLLFI